MNSGIYHGSWYTGGGGGRAACDDCCRTMGGVRGCGEDGRGSQAIEGAADGVRAWVRVGVAI
jgi:hypothetical protein